MRVLFWYCDRFAWNPAMKTLADVSDASPSDHEQCIVAFIHVEPQDVQAGSTAETKLVKNTKWLARKWKTRCIVLHSFSHLAAAKADPEPAGQLIDRAHARLTEADYQPVRTPYGYFNDLAIEAPGHPLARIYKEL